MEEPRRGCQTPSRSVFLPYSKTYGQEAVDLYDPTGRTAQEWQKVRDVVDAYIREKQFAGICRDDCGERACIAYKKWGFS